MSVHKIEGVDGVDHFPKKYVTLYASGLLAAGDFVMIDPLDTTNGLGASVRKSQSGYNANIHEGLCIGVATETVAAGKYCVIQTAGKYENASVATTVVSGQNLVMSASPGMAQDATQLDSSSNADALERNIIAVALESEASATGTEPASGTTNKADVLIVDQGYF